MILISNDHIDDDDGDDDNNDGDADDNVDDDDNDNDDDNDCAGFLLRVSHWPNSLAEKEGIANLSWTATNQPKLHCALVSSKACLGHGVFELKHKAKATMFWQRARSQIFLDLDHDLHDDHDNDGDGDNDGGGDNGNLIDNMKTKNNIKPTILRYRTEGRGVNYRVSNFHNVFYRTWGLILNHCGTSRLANVYMGVSQT